MIRRKLLPLLAVLCFSSCTVGAWADSMSIPAGRFFHGGDGRINLRSNKNSAEFHGRYRIGPKAYDPVSYQAICRVFGVPSSENSALALRLIEFIDAVQDHFNPGAEITITSGYRSPEYNTQLRKKGRLAAKASLHQYGMAADLKMTGVPARRIWSYVKALGYGGAGYYHGETVHLDVGPARSWDEKSSGVGTGISDDNKLIGMVTQYDIYGAGEPMTLRFIRMTAFPIGVSMQFVLYRQTDPAPEAIQRFIPEVSIPDDSPCLQFGDIGQMDNIRWKLPANLAPGLYRIRARFCNSPWPQMPAEVDTPAFEVVGP